jgi:hypothetical protein
MNLFITFYIGLLFFALTPSILVSLPPKGTKYTVALFHSAVFALVFHFTHPFVLKITKGIEGFIEGAAKPTQLKKKSSNCTKDNECSSKKCVKGNDKKNPSKKVC